jgi:hypothetical protein
MVNEASQAVSKKSIKECQFSAQFWAENIGLYADHVRRISQRFAIGSAVLSALTGLGVWSVLAASTQWPAVLAVSLVSLVSSALAIIPKIIKYEECAKAAASLTSSYGHVLGELNLASELLSNKTDKASEIESNAIKHFEEVKTIKDNLQPFPKDLQEEKNLQWEEFKKSNP